MVSTRLNFVEFKVDDVEREAEQRRVNAVLAAAIAQRAKFATIRLEGQRATYRARLTYNGDDSFNLSEFKRIDPGREQYRRRYLRRGRARA